MIGFVCGSTILEGVRERVKGLVMSGFVGVCTNMEESLEQTGWSPSIGVVWCGIAEGVSSKQATGGVMHGCLIGRTDVERSGPSAGVPVLLILAQNMGVWLLIEDTGDTAARAALFML